MRGVKNLRDNSEIIKMKQPIRLRGHHISTLATYIFRTSGNYLKHSERDYGVEHVKRTTEIYEHIVRNPDSTIIITDSLDSICEANCQKWVAKQRASEGDCNSEADRLHDLEVMEDYDVELGRISCGELVRKISVFKEISDLEGVPSMGNSRIYRLNRSLLDAMREYRLTHPKK